MPLNEQLAGPTEKKACGLTPLAGMVLALCLAACTTYRPRPLPLAPGLATDIAAVKVDPDSFPLPRLKEHPFALSDGLDWVEIAMLAVANNPGLKAARLRRGEAAAQVYAAGLLPDPRLSAGLDHPTSGGPDVVEGFDFGLSYDIQALITRGAERQAATASQRQVDLELLWQEWQVIQQARLLLVQVDNGARKLALLQKTRARYEDRYREVRNLMERGDLTLEAAGAMTSAWFDVSSRLARARQAYRRHLHELHALLGLAPETELPLAPLGPVPPVRKPDQRIWSELPRRRPDLQALQAGYQSQEQRLRKAVLAQFPALSIGFTRARDTDGVHTTGFGITLDLPLFSGSRGDIATERASRARLLAEYQARLDQTRSDVSRVLDRQQLLLQRQAELQQHLPTLEALVSPARRAYRHGDLAALDLLNLETTLLDQRLESMNLEEALWTARISLDTLLAWPEPEE